MNRIAIVIKITLLLFAAHSVNICNGQSNDVLVDSLYDRAWNYYDIFQTAGFHNDQEYINMKEGKYDQRELRLKYVVSKGLDVSLLNNCHGLHYLTITEIKDTSILSKLKFENFPELRKFCITDNLLTNKIFQELCKCKKLRYLVVIGCAEPIIIPKEIAELKNLQVVHVYSTIFAEVASEFAEIAPREFSLRGCVLNGQEDKLLSGSKVKFLELFSCPIPRLPQTMSAMTSLESLFLWGTNTENADVLASCQNLRMLDMSGLPLKELPSFEKTNLFSIYIQNMNLVKIPNLGDGCNSLMIEDSEIEDYEIQMTNYDRLRDLYILNSNFERIPESWRKLKGLKTLYIRYSQITSLPDWIGEMSIENLDLKGHMLLALPVNFHQLPLVNFYLGDLRKVLNWEEVFMIKSDVVCCSFTSKTESESEREYYFSNPIKYPLYRKLRFCVGCYLPILPTIFQI